LSSAGTPPGDKAAAWLLGLLDEKDPPLRLAVIKAVEDTRLAKAAPLLVKLLSDKSRPEAERTAAAGAVELLRGLVLECWVVGPFGDDLKAEYPPEAKPDHAATYPGSKPGEKLAWQSLSAEPNGFLNLRSVFQRDRLSAYALAYVYSPQAQKVQMLLGADDTVRVWLNGKMVHEHATPRPARPDDDRVEVALTKGWNTVLVKVVNVQAAHGLYLRFAGGQGLRVALRPSE
jgi:hypothetical protein